MWSCQWWGLACRLEASEQTWWLSWDHNTHTHTHPQTKINKNPPQQKPPNLKLCNKALKKRGGGGLKKKKRWKNTYALSTNCLRWTILCYLFSEAVPTTEQHERMLVFFQLLSCSLHFPTPFFFSWARRLKSCTADDTLVDFKKTGLCMSKWKILLLFTEKKKYKRKKNEQKINQYFLFSLKKKKNPELQKSLPGSAQRSRDAEF